MKPTELFAAVEKIDAVLDAALFAAGVTLEQYQAVKAGAVAGSCQRCGAEFLTGPQTSHRSHRKFCSDRCRVAAMRNRQSRGKKARFSPWPDDHLLDRSALGAWAYGVAREELQTIGDIRRRTDKELLSISGIGRKRLSALRAESALTVEDYKWHKLSRDERIREIALR